CTSSKHLIHSRLMAQVKIYVYDISNGLIRTLPPHLLGGRIDGIWHTSVVVYGLEYYFGQGILFELPGNTIHGSPQEIIDMGETEIPSDIFEEYISELREIFTAESYHLLDNNCNTFTNKVCQFLTGKSLPDHITNLPADFLTTPLGQQFRPMLESMFGPSRLS
ncbi:4369_t:CDS:2, partial [Acaulospora morrowiae]